MTKPKLKLVICDVDWTLLWRDHRYLSDYTKNVLEKMHEKGVYFGIGSGRPISEVFSTFDEWNLRFKCDMIIGLNGVQIWDENNQKLVENYKLKKEWIKEIVEMMMPLDVNPYMYYHNNEFIAMKKDEIMERTAIRNGRKLHIAKNIDDFASEDNAKIMIRVKEEQMARFEDFIKEHPSTFYKEFKTQDTLMEFTDKRVSKGVALKDYCQIKNISLASVVAFGDTTNDNTMLQNAGFGVCLLNGSDDTKEIADAVTDYSVQEDGVAHYLEDHIFKQFDL